MNKNTYNECSKSVAIKSSAVLNLKLLYCHKRKKEVG